MTPSKRLDTPAPATSDAWCPDDETRHNVVARRNVLFALWAGGELGLTGADLTAYSVEVHVSDYEITGDGDILAKVMDALHAAGLPYRLAELRLRLAECHRKALLQTHATD